MEDASKIPARINPRDIILRVIQSQKTQKSMSNELLRVFKPLEQMPKIGKTWLRRSMIL